MEREHATHALRSSGEEQGLANGLAKYIYAFGFLLCPDFRANYLISLVELSGIEPLTSSLRTRRSPN